MCTYCLHQLLASQSPPEWYSITACPSWQAPYNTGNRLNKNAPVHELVHPDSSLHGQVSVLFDWKSMLFYFQQMGEQRISPSTSIRYLIRPSYLTYVQSTSWETLGWKKHKLESRLPGEISITSDMQMTPPLWQKVKRNSKASWMKVEEESEKAGLKFSIQKTKIMASGPITSWEIDGETLSGFF